MGLGNTLLLTTVVHDCSWTGPTNLSAWVSGVSLAGPSKLVELDHRVLPGPSQPPNEWSGLGSPDSLNNTREAKLTT